MFQTAARNLSLLVLCGTISFSLGLKDSSAQSQALPPKTTQTQSAQGHPARGEQIQFDQNGAEPSGAKQTGDETSWKYGGGDARIDLLLHTISQTETRDGQVCEQLRFNASNGTTVYYHKPFGTAWVIPELSISLWVRANRPGLQLGARIVLPRSVDPRTGEPMTTLIRGDRYDRVGNWQRLTIPDIERQVARAARAFRHEFGPSIDEREAYVDLAVLNAYTGQGQTEVWIDDLEVQAAVAVAPERQRTVSSNRISDSPTRRGLVSFASNSEKDTSASHIRFRGGSLSVNGRRMAPRVISYQGEPLAFLRQLGFNTVSLARPATREILNEAKQEKMWLICPPPGPDSVITMASAGSPSSRSLSSGPHGSARGDSSANNRAPQNRSPYDVVLAWSLGKKATAADLVRARELAQAVQRDAGLRRPFIVQPLERVAEYSRVADCLLLGRSPMFSTIDLASYSPWYTQRINQTRPGTPVWSTIQTQPDPLLIEQWRTLAPRYASRLTLSYDQMQTLVRQALRQESRGLFFESHSPLTARDEATQQRAAALELINLRLETMAPWTLGGTLAPQATSTNPAIESLVLRNDRAMLVIPYHQAKPTDSARPPKSKEKFALVIPGAPEASQVYELTPAAIRPLRHRRGAGGLRVTLDEFDSTTMVLVTHDLRIVGEVTQRLASQAQRSARVYRQLAANRYDLATLASNESSSQTNPRTTNRPSPSAQLPAIQTQINECDKWIKAGDWRRATRQATRALTQLHLLDQQQANRLSNELSAPGGPASAAQQPHRLINSPLTTHPALIPANAMLQSRVAAQQPRANLLLADNFENTRQTVAAGWRNVHYPTPNIKSNTTIAATPPRPGEQSQSAMRLSASDQTLPSEDAEPAQLDSPPVWVTSPTLQVRAGSLLQIEGWVRVPEKLAGGGEGLMVFDSLGGEALAQRFDATGQWRQFQIFRAVPQSGPMTLTFALSGIGEAFVDDVTVKEIPLDALGRLDQTLRMRDVFNRPQLRR